MTEHKHIRLMCCICGAEGVVVAGIDEHPLIAFVCIIEEACPACDPFGLIDIEQWFDMEGQPISSRCH
jgi:hypothetical protein